MQRYQCHIMLCQSRSQSTGFSRYSIIICGLHLTTMLMAADLVSLLSALILSLTEVNIDLFYLQIVGPCSSGTGTVCKYCLFNFLFYVNEFLSSR